MKRIFTVIMLVLLMYNVIINTCYEVKANEKLRAEHNYIPDELKNLYAQSAVLMDADTGRILFGKNESKVMPMASTTKIMTCILVLENTSPSEKALVSSYAASQPKVKLGVSKEEQYYIKDLLYSLMLESHNDSAVVLAEHVSGTVEDFAKLMNEKAYEIGCEHTNFITPNGLDAINENGIHATTARDLAKIMRYCINVSERKENFLEITQTRNYSFTDVSEKRHFNCTNHNAFLDMMDGALSGKTGFTGAAGYCYVGALEQNEEKYIVALLACGWPNNKGYKWNDTKKLMQYGIENYSYKNIWRNIEIDDIKVQGALSESDQKELFVDVEIEGEPNELCILTKDDEHVNIDIDIPTVVEAPVKEKSKAGEIKYYISSEEIGKWNIVFCQNIDKKTYWKCLVKITKKVLFL